MGHPQDNASRDCKSLLFYRIIRLRFINSMTRAIEEIDLQNKNQPESRHHSMTVRLNRIGFERAKELVMEGRVVIDERDAWSEHQPSTGEENKFIQANGFTEYGKWHLGVDDEEGENTKKRYKFPYGDFVRVHRCAVLSAESRAGQYKHFDIERAAAHLHGMIEEKRQKVALTCRLIERLATRGHLRQVRFLLLTFSADFVLSLPGCSRADIRSAG
jgi:hypothetical protein